MKRSKLVGLAMVALAAVSCGGDPDLAELLEGAGFSSDDHNLASSLRERGLLCEDDQWLAEVYWPPFGHMEPEAASPPIERILFVAWDMPAGTLRGWDLVRDKADRTYWSVALSADEVGFGCDERYTTSFFLLASWPDDRWLDDRVSRPVGLDRGERLAFFEGISSDDDDLVTLAAEIDADVANVPGPDTATYYLQNLFVGTTFSTDVPTERNDSGYYTTEIEVDYRKLDLHPVTDVVTGVVYKREGVPVTNHCLTVTDTTIP